MTLETATSAGFIRLATQDKTILTLINGNAADLAALLTTEKGTVVGSINELFGLVGAAATINDSSTGTTETLSSAKILSEIQAAKDSLLGGASAEFDTLVEIQTALQNDPNVIAALQASGAGSVRFDVTQTLTIAQQNQAQANLGVVAASDIGDFNRDFVALDIEPNLI